MAINQRAKRYVKYILFVSTFHIDIIAFHFDFISTFCTDFSCIKYKKLLNGITEVYLTGNDLSKGILAKNYDDYLF